MLLGTTICFSQTVLHERVSILWAIKNGVGVSGGHTSSSRSSLPLSLRRRRRRRGRRLWRERLWKQPWSRGIARALTEAERAVRAAAATSWIDGTGDERDAWPWWRRKKFKRAKCQRVDNRARCAIFLQAEDDQAKEAVTPAAQFPAG